VSWSFQEKAKLQKEKADLIFETAALHREKNRMLETMDFDGPQVRMCTGRQVIFTQVALQVSF
jgi:hypothetical protein